MANLPQSRARCRDGFAAELENDLQIRVHPLDDSEEMRRHAELGEHGVEHVPRHRVERLLQIHEEYLGLQSVLPPLLQGLPDTKAPICAASSAGEAILLFDALLFQQQL